MLWLNSNKIIIVLSCLKWRGDQILQSSAVVYSFCIEYGRNTLRMSLSIPDQKGGGTLAIVYLIEDHPVGVNLRVALWVQHHSLIGSEVGQGDLSILWAVVDYVDDIVLVKVSFTRVSNFVLCNTKTQLRNHPAETHTVHTQEKTCSDTNCRCPFGLGWERVCSCHHRPVCRRYRHHRHIHLPIKIIIANSKFGTQSHLCVSIHEMN